MRVGRRPFKWLCQGATEPQAAVQRLRPAPSSAIPSILIGRQCHVRNGAFPVARPPNFVLTVSPTYRSLTRPGRRRADDWFRRCCSAADLRWAATLAPNSSTDGMSAAQTTELTDPTQCSQHICAVERPEAVARKCIRYRTSRAASALQTPTERDLPRLHWSVPMTALITPSLSTPADVLAGAANAFTSLVAVLPLGIVATSSLRACRASA